MLYSHPGFVYKSNILSRPLGSGWVRSVGYWIGSDWVKKFEPMYISELNSCEIIFEVLQPM